MRASSARRLLCLNLFMSLSKSSTIFRDIDEKLNQESGRNIVKRGEREEGRNIVKRGEREEGTGQSKRIQVESKTIESTTATQQFNTFTSEKKNYKLFESCAEEEHLFDIELAASHVVSQLTAPPLDYSWNKQAGESSPLARITKSDSASMALPKELQKIEEKAKVRLATLIRHISTPSNHPAP